MMANIYFCTWSEAPTLKQLLAQKVCTIAKLSTAMHLCRKALYRVLVLWRQKQLVQRIHYRNQCRYYLTKLGRNTHFVYCPRLCTVQYCKAIATLLDPFQGMRTGAIANALGLRWNTAKEAADVLVAAGIAECIDRFYYLNEAFAGVVVS